MNMGTESTEAGGGASSHVCPSPKSVPVPSRSRPAGGGRGHDNLSSSEQDDNGVFRRTSPMFSMLCPSQAGHFSGGQDHHSAAYRSEWYNTLIIV